MLRDISHRHWRAKYCPSHGREGNANPMIRNRLLRVVSRGRNRTYNIVIKSHLLRQIERSDHLMQTGTAARKSLSSHANFTIEPLDQKRARDIALCRSTRSRSDRVTVIPPPPPTTPMNPTAIVCSNRVVGCVHYRYGVAR